MRVEQPRSARVWTAVGECARREGVPVSLRHVVVTCAGALEGMGAGLSLLRDSSRPSRSWPAARRPRHWRSCSSPSARGRAWTPPPAAGPCWWPTWPGRMRTASGRYSRRRPPTAVCARCSPSRWRSGPPLVGVLDVYRSQPGPLAAYELAHALIFADGGAADPGLARRDHLRAWTARLSQLSARHRVHVHQATGMVAAQLGVPMTDALAALRAYAFTSRTGPR